MQDTDIISNTLLKWEMIFGGAVGITWLTVKISNFHFTIEFYVQFTAFAIAFDMHFVNKLEEFCWSLDLAMNKNKNENKNSVMNKIQS